jgi:hypothetical protein
MARKYELNEDEAIHCETLKNRIVAAVEHDDLERARLIAADLRIYQRLFAKLTGLLTLRPANAHP